MPYDTKTRVCIALNHPLRRWVRFTTYLGEKKKRRECMVCGLWPNPKYLYDDL